MNAEFASAVQDWSAWLLHNAGRSPATVSKYVGHLHRFGAWYTDPPKDPALAPTGRDPLRPGLDDLERFAGVYAHALKLSPRARRPLVSALRGFFAWLPSCKAAGVAGNPAAALPQPKAGKPLPRAASLRDAEQLLMAPDVTTFMGMRDAAILAVLAGCGLRVSGLVRLNDSALTWYDDEQGRECLVLRALEKGDKERLVPVPHEAALLLRAYLGHEELAKIPRTLPDGDAVLFVTTHNRTIPECDYYGEARRMTRAAILDMIKRYAERAGVPEAIAHPHALRHLYGAEMAEDDAPMLTQQALMGHSDPKSTAVYASLAHRKLRRTVDQSNPLAKMRAPLLETLRTLHRATSTPTHAHSGPPALQKSNTGKPRHR